MENTVKMTRESLRAMFNEEIVKLCQKKSDLMILIEEKYEIADGDAARIHAENFITHALNIYQSDTTGELPSFRVFANDLLENMDTVLSLVSSADKEAFLQFHGWRRHYPAGVTEYALRIIDCENEFYQRSGLKEVLKFAEDVCAQADSQKYWGDWDQSRINLFIELVSASFAWKQQAVFCRMRLAQFRRLL